jgi:hypothetical protein
MKINSGLKIVGGWPVCFIPGVLGCYKFELDAGSGRTSSLTLSPILRKTRRFVVGIDGAGLNTGP